MRKTEEEDVNALAQTVGKNKRINRLLKNGKGVFVPIDDFLISGPYNTEVNIGDRIKHIIKGRPDALLGYIGAARNYTEEIASIPYILNLTASSSLSNPTYKILCTSFEQALQIDAEAVAVHINISSKYEGEMLHMLEKIADKCSRYGMPLMVIIYPRTEGKDCDYREMKETEPVKYTELLAHAVHMAVELGADIIKTQYSGSSETFARVVDAACGNPLLAAGGEVCDLDKVLRMACGVMKAGSSGVCFGRNVFLSRYPEKIIYLLHRIVHDEESFDKIMYEKEGWTL